MEIRTDSKYVYDGFRTNLQKWKTNGWRKAGRAVCNTDLWMELREILGNREADSVSMRKVKGHASADDVSKGLATPEDKWGNDKADELAGYGATLGQTQGLSMYLGSSMHTAHRGEYRRCFV